MANYRDWEMLNQAISGLGEGAARRRATAAAEQRDMERLALERQMRDQQAQRFDAQAEHDRRMEDIATAGRVNAYVRDPQSGATLGYQGAAPGFAKFQSDLAAKTGRDWQVIDDPTKRRTPIGEIHMKDANGNTLVHPFFEGEEDAMAKTWQQTQAMPKPEGIEPKLVLIRDEKGNVIWRGVQGPNLHPTTEPNKGHQITTVDVTPGVLPTDPPQVHKKTTTWMNLPDNEAGASDSPSASEADTDFVRMKNPDGATVKVPKEKVEQARKLGYQ